MTTPAPEAAATAAGVNTGAAAENATAAADNHTPDPPVTATETAPAEAADEGKDELRDIVAGLATTVGTLVNEVAGLKNPEAKVQHVPWTHRGSRKG